MAYLHSDVLDSGLNVLTNATSKVLHICPSEPTDRAGALAASLGNKSSFSIGAPGARTPSGRKVTTGSVSDGAVTGNGTATHYAIVDGTRLLAAGPLQAGQAVTSGNAFTLAAFDIGIPGPA
jgi:hypothetical protein